MPDFVSINLIPLFKQNAHWPEVEQILSNLHKAGAVAYLAGGCVRDALLNRITKDFDIATSANPDQVLKLFPKNSQKQGKAFGVIAFNCSQGQIEIATFRKEGLYLDGRHPQTVNLQNISAKEDALRRDFTVNALFYDVKKKQVVDYIDGLKDLKQKIIQTVGQPQLRFKEDHLRILRAVRFSLQLDFQIEKNTYNTLLSMRQSLLKISKERIYGECQRILNTRKWIPAFSFLKKLDLLQRFWKNPSSAEWSFCLSFWTDLSKEKGTAVLTKQNEYFSWIVFFYPLLIQNLDDLLDEKGNWKKSTLFFSEKLKQEKLPLSLIKTLQQVLYDSACLLDLRKVRKGKKWRILNKKLAQIILFLSRKYLNNKKLNKDIIDKIKEDYDFKFAKTGLPPPLVKGEDLLSFILPKKRAFVLDYLYDLQLEEPEQNKKKLIKVAKSLV